MSTTSSRHCRARPRWSAPPSADGSPCRSRPRGRSWCPSWSFWLEDPAPRERVIDMQERSFELQLESEAECVDPEQIDLTAVTARTLVAVGELDKPDFHAIAKRLASEIEEAQSATIAGAGHLPSLERPEETGLLVREFLQR